MNQSSTPWDALSGRYQLSPGRSPGVTGQRPVLTEGRLGRLLRGQTGEQVGRTLSAVFTLCAHAHRGTADRAVAAAGDGVDVLPTLEQTVLLSIETARDHLRSIALEWPQRVPALAAEARNSDWLRDCPLSLASSRHCTDAAEAFEALRQLRAWLETRILQQDASRWLAEQRDPDALALWCKKHSGDLPPARCLADWRALAHTMSPESRSLDLLDPDPAQQTERLQQLAQTLLADPDFVQRPSWRGQCAETGPWTRLRQRRLAAAPSHTAWTRLSARWLELVELAAAASTASQGAAPLLASGALKLGQGQALAWSEMARGLLLHWVQLDAAGGVQDYRVVAPTEWNFHPAGALSCALTALPIGSTLAAQTLAAAYDPCVACVLQTGEDQ